MPHARLLGMTSLDFPSLVRRAKGAYETACIIIGTQVSMMGKGLGLSVMCGLRGVSWFETLKKGGGSAKKRDA